jgi:predicted RNase H-like HicB family nuclease
MGCEQDFGVDCRTLVRDHWSMNRELIFDVTQEADGGFVAEALGEDIFTQGDTWDELCRNVREAVAAHFFDRQLPTSLRLHLVRDQVLMPA